MKSSLLERGDAGVGYTASSTFDTKEAAVYLGLSKPYLDKLRCFGGGPRFAKIGRRVVYRLRDLDAWLEQHLKSNTSDAADRRVQGS
jgi:excisionase family DNA binding protein